MVATSSGLGLTEGGPLIPPSTPAHQRSASGPRPSVGASTLANFGKGTENQDAYVMTSNNCGSKCLVGVFDGHGEKGRHISTFVRTALSKRLLGHETLHSDPKAALEGAYRDTQKLIEKMHGPDAHESGTTAVAAYQHHDRLYVANVGDSRAVLGRCDTARKDAQALRAVELSSDQKPSRTDEKQRILAAGGRVEQSSVPVRTVNGVRWLRMGPERVMDKTVMGGLAMSRSLGDLSLRPYVSSQPEFMERRLDSRDKVLVVGSDGVWDRLSSQEAIEIAGKQGDPSAAAREITRLSRQRWHAETEGLLSDDITAVVVHLEHDASRSSRRAPGDEGVTPSAQMAMRRMPGDRSPASPSLARQRGSQAASVPPLGLTVGRTRPATGTDGGRKPGVGNGRSLSETRAGGASLTWPPVEGRGLGGKANSRPEALPAAGRRSRRV